MKQKTEEGFYFLPKKWLGDAIVIAMDWDCKAMHLHLMAIAWQQTPRGYLLDSDPLIRKLLNNPDLQDWENRIKKQIFNAWKKTTLVLDGIEQTYWYQPGMIKTVNASTSLPVAKKAKRVTSKKQMQFSDDENIFDGFNLIGLLNAKATSTILYEKANQEDRTSIWTLGVELVKKQSGSEANARSFLAGIIKKYGEKTVAQAIGQLSAKRDLPVEIHSYLIGILKQSLNENKKTTGRGSVAI